VAGSCEYGDEPLGFGRTHVSRCVLIRTCTSFSPRASIMKIVTLSYYSKMLPSCFINKIRYVYCLLMVLCLLICAVRIITILTAKTFDW
jgi:hypothetical protein